MISGHMRISIKLASVGTKARWASKCRRYEGYYLEALALNDVAPPALLKAFSLFWRCCCMMSSEKRLERMFETTMIIIYADQAIHADCIAEKWGSPEHLDGFAKGVWDIEGYIPRWKFKFKARTTVYIFVQGFDLHLKCWSATKSECQDALGRRVLASICWDGIVCLQELFMLLQESRHVGRANLFLTL